MVSIDFVCSWLKRINLLCFLCLILNLETLTIYVICSVFVLKSGGTYKNGIFQPHRMRFRDSDRLLLYREERLMYNLEYISSYVKSVIAATMGEIVFRKLSDEDGVFLYMEKKVGYQLCRKALDLSWEWIERKNTNEIEPWIFCDYLDDANGIDLISYESDAVKAGDKESANIYGIMNCIILYIAYQAFEYAGKKYLPDYLWGIDDNFYAEGILDYTSKIRGCNFEDILDYCNRKLEKSSDIIFKKEEMINIFLECK